MDDTVQMGRVLRNERGIALLVVLLVTALLIALIFEFAYATRISLNTAVNFRDSQRAYYLARSGIYAFKKYGPELRKYTPQGEWGLVPVISEGETQVLFKWEDEKGKLAINAIDNSSLPVREWVDRLFSNQGLATDVYNKVIEKRKEGSFKLKTELHSLMSDEDYQKVAPFLSVYYSDKMVNPNAASAEVLESIGFSSGAARDIIQQRIQDPLDAEKIKPYLPTTFLPSSDYFISTIFTVYARATVGGYTKQIEAVVKDGTISYWRSM